MLPSESYFWSLWRAGSGSRGPFGLDKGMSLGARIRWHSGKETIFRPELAIAEAVLATCGRRARQVMIDSFQVSAYSNVGWELLRSAGLGATSRLLVEPSSLALPRLLGEGFVADAAFVDGSHRFHEVFVDLYFLRKLVRPGGLVVLDDVEWPSVGGALAYFDLNLRWQPVDLGRRLAGRRLPDEPVEPAFTDFRPFLPLA